MCSTIGSPVIILSIQVAPPPKLHRDELAAVSAVISAFLKKLLERMESCTSLSNDRGKLLILALVDYVTCLDISSSRTL